VAKVLVCGSNYGRVYIEALKLTGSRHTLAGILARGSPRSREVARKEGVRLYRTVSELPSDIELACVAVGSSAIEVVFELLKRGIPVLCEHPLKAGDVCRALKLAQAAGTVFNVNGHFADLETVAPFHRTCRQLGENQPVIAIDLMVVDRSLYGGLDIVRRSLHSSTPFEFRRNGKSGPFERLAGTIGGTPITVSVQTSGVRTDSSLEDGSPEYLTDIRVCMIYQSGILTLLSIAGPVIWNRNYIRFAAERGFMCDLLSPFEISGSDLSRMRIQANLRAVGRIFEQVQSARIAPGQQPQELMEVAELWETVGGLLRR